MSAADKMIVYEVNTWVWLDTLSRRDGRLITLSTVPDADVDALARTGITTIWLMGVWQRSPLSRASALNYRHEYRTVLPDLRDDDVIGSAYAVYDYEVDDRLGGRDGLASLRRRLKKRGLSLMLDFVPNHVAADHVWTRERPEFIVQGKQDDLSRRSHDFYARLTTAGELVLAHGKDPYFPGWEDTAQLNVFHPGLRKAMIKTLLSIATQCDGVRCDMAMLLMNDTFSATWRGCVGAPLDQEFWREVIPAIKAKYPRFTFTAEVYWDLEFDILQQGFDYAYDKRFYDRLISGDISKVWAHLLAPIDYQNHLIRFIENHDEPRAYTRFGDAFSIAAATLICTLPGAALLHDGQFTGRTKKLPVQIKRQPDESPIAGLEAHYLKLLEDVCHPVYRGHFFLFQVTTAGDATSPHLLAYGWQIPGEAYRLIVINGSAVRSFGRINLSGFDRLVGQTWCLTDLINGAEYVREGFDLTGGGLFIDLQPYQSHLFRFEPVHTLEAIVM